MTISDSQLDCRQNSRPEIWYNKWKSSRFWRERSRRIHRKYGTHINDYLLISCSAAGSERDVKACEPNYGQKAETTRTHGYDTVRQEVMVKSTSKKHDVGLKKWAADDEKDEDLISVPPNPILY